LAGKQAKQQQDTAAALDTHECATNELVGTDLQSETTLLT